MTEEEEAAPATPRDVRQRLFSDAQRKLLYKLSVPDERLHVLGVVSVLLNTAVVLRWPQHYWCVGISSVISLRFCLLLSGVVPCALLLDLLGGPLPLRVLYLAQACVLLPWRLIRFRRTNEELLLSDFCYW